MQRVKPCWVLRAQFFQDASANISSATSGFAITSALINWAPCAVQIAPGGVGIGASGFNVQPSGARPAAGDAACSSYVCRSGLVGRWAPLP